MRQNPDKSVKEIARQRITILFQQARKRFLTDQELSNRYVHLAQKIAMKARIHMPKEAKGLYCKHCLSFLYLPYNVRVRLQKRHIAQTCLMCNRTMRHPYIREQKARRAASQKRKSI